MRFKPKMSITCNSLNLPSSITYSDGHRVYYTYDAMRRKQRITYQTAILPAAGILPRAELIIPDESAEELDGTRGVTRYRTVLTRDYVDNLVFENGELKYVITPPGFIEDGEYYHQLADYEGNSMVVIDNEGTVYERNNYYPFGLPIVDEHYASAITPYKYGGKEFDTMNGLNAYDFSARILDPALCQFTTADPLAEHYYPYSPYLYCAGNPILFVDPTGLGGFYLFDVVGNYMGYIDCDDIDSDVICIVEYQNGQKVIKQDSSGKFLQAFVGAGTFDVLRHGRGYDVYTVQGDNNARSIFEFFANTVSKVYNIEYSLLLTGINRHASINYITTSHTEHSEGGIVSLYRDIILNISSSFIREFTHTHPTTSYSSDSDRIFSHEIFYQQDSSHNNLPVFSIFYVPTGIYIPYMPSLK